MRFRFLWIGKTRDPLFFEIEERYLKRIRQYFPAQRESIRERKKADPRQRAAQLELEAKEIEKRRSVGNYLVVLDHTGRQFTSEQYASLLSKLMNRSVAEITYVAGGYVGVPSGTRESADLVVSLSRLTLPHELARLVLLEQTYRAVTILRGLPYHK